MSASWFTRLIWVLLPVIMWTGSAGADWASAQSARGVTQEPNDFWYWHRINETVPIWDFDPEQHISYDPDHSFFWHWGPNYLNMPRAWGILRHANPPPVGIFSTDSEFFVTHWDLEDNIIRIEAEERGLPNVDDDGDGFVDYVSGFNVNDDAVVVVDGMPPGNVSTDFNAHGSAMIGQAIAVTNNESWWVERDPEDYLAEVPNKTCGLPGLLWNYGKFYGAITAGARHRAAEYADWLNTQGYNIKVASCSWINHSEEWANRLEGYGILLVTGSSNTNWEVNGGAENKPCIVAGGVEKDTYRRSLFSGPEDGVCYRVPTGEPTVTIDVNGYTARSGSVFIWNGDPDLWSYGGHDIDDPHILTLVTTFYKSYGREGSRDLDDYIQTTMSMFPGVGSGIVQGTASSPVLSPCISHSDLRTSGATTQAASVAALVYVLNPDLTPQQVQGMVRRGCVTVDPFNDDTCCDDPDKENCFTWTDGLDDNPLDGVMQDGGFSGSGEITGRIEGDDCAGLLGAGRLDAYRTLTLWGLVDQDTTLSGDIYVSGDVVISSCTVTVEPGTRFFIAPDDITYLDPWEPEAQYDMSNARGDDIGYFEDFPTTPYGQIEFVLYDAGAALVFNSTPDNPAVFDSFVNDAQTDDDWIGINDRSPSQISTPNGSGSYEVLHSTLGVH